MLESSAQQARSALTLDARRAYEAELIERAWSDPEFRSLLATDPKTALNDALGLDVPEDVEIQVIFEKPRRIVIVVPMSTEELEADELSEAERRRSDVASPSMCHITCVQWAGTC